MVYLCLDLGTRHTGLAVSHEGQLAEPLTVVTARSLDSLLHQLRFYLEKYQPDLIVIGTPAHGPVSALAADVASRLQPSWKTLLVNEDDSSVMAEKMLRSSGLTPRAAKTKDHQAAAAFILQSYLDSQ